MFDTLVSVFPFAFLAYIIFINFRRLTRTLKSMPFSSIIGLFLSYSIVILLSTILLYFIANPFINKLEIDNSFLETGLKILFVLIVIIPMQYVIYKITKIYTMKRK